MAKIRTMLAIVPLLASGRTVAAQNATSGSAQGATSGPLQTGVFKIILHGQNHANDGMKEIVKLKLILRLSCL
jgi:hypothetical protein